MSDNNVSTNAKCTIVMPNNSRKVMVINEGMSVKAVLNEVQELRGMDVTVRIKGAGINQPDNQVDNNVLNETPVVDGDVITLTPRMSGG